MIAGCRHTGWVHSRSDDHPPTATTAPTDVSLRGPLRPLEYAWIAIFGGLAVAAVVIGSVIPLAGAVRVLAPVPLALVAARTRPRAMVAATVTTVVVSFAMAGTGAAISVLGSAVVGGIVGEIKRRGRGWVLLLTASVVAAPLLGGVSVGLLLVLAPLRRLVLETTGNTLGGLAKWFDKVSVLSGVADMIESLRRGVLEQWWIWIWVMGIASVLLTMAIAWWVLGAVVDRLADIPSEDTLATAVSGSPNAAASSTAGPLPLRLEGVCLRYRADGPQILNGVDLSIVPAEFVAVVGANGSGKSTLAKILAGRPPTSGTVIRSGPAGLGHRGGTAMVLQRPETQMLGARVADDVVWGLPPDMRVDVDALLAEVGLGGLGARETSDLSGGQQQRLCIAAALAREPALLIADEVTSMIDPDGRDEVLKVLAELPRRRGVAVVLITHRVAEAAAADRIVHLVGGRVVPELPGWMPRPDGTIAQSPHPHLVAPEARWQELRSGPEPTGAPVLRLDGVGHTFLGGSPWEVRALRDVSLTVHRGEGLLIVGGNGSGKTTLAWVMAGLLAPTEGECVLYRLGEQASDAGAPVSRHVGEVGLAFQHARLQLQKQIVGDDIMAVGGEAVGSAEVARALEAVGLGREIAARRIDALSGGQMRRVVLAGLIARNPQVLVLDEPLAGLDPDAREDVVALLARLRAEGMTIVIISHDFGSLGRLCTRRILLADGALVSDPIAPETVTPETVTPETVTAETVATGYTLPSFRAPGERESR
ncbi:MAG: ATP-binding cassette domain-containing protein [Gordonia sp. (in: high G+C Gram-positive bacteria)]